MCHNGPIPAFNSAVCQSSATELRSFFSELNELPELVMHRFIPRELRGLHLRALQHMSRADVMHALSEIAAAVQEEGPDVLKQNRWQYEFQRSFRVHHLVFSGMSFSSYDGLLARFSVKTKDASQKARFLWGADLVLLWKEGIPMNEENCFIAIVKGDARDEVDLDNVVSLSPVDILRCWPSLDSGALFVLVRSQNFYLPTAASLTQLRIQESKVNGNTEPILLRALLTGDGATNPPTYLQDNPLIELGCCVALRAGSNSRQPALSDWPGCDWSEKEEAKIREESSGETALLDRTQMDALQHIMRNQIAVVHGTPGTGKSFVGSKFLQILLRNREELRIGPIIVMTFTHHALESVFESLVPVARRYKANIGLIGRTKSEELAPYCIPIRRQQNETTKKIIRVAEEINAIKSYTTVSEETEDKTLAVMAKHMDPNTYDEWEKRSMQYRKNQRHKREEYSMLRKEVSNKLCIEIRDNLEDLEKMSLALKTKQWHGEVNIMPFLKAKVQCEWGIYFDKIMSTLNDITAVKRETPLNESLLDELVKEVEEYFSRLPNDQNNNILTDCIDIFVRELGNLIAMKKFITAAHTSLMESWRLEEMRESQTTLQIVDETPPANESAANIKQTEAVDTRFEKFQREKEERRRRERDLGYDDTELNENKYRMKFLSLPPKEETSSLGSQSMQSYGHCPTR